MADQQFMQRALDLARLGTGRVSPNPMVGCVLVHEGKIIGEGYHQKYGEAHAEVNAIRDVKNQSLLKESTAYVTLEPCSHFGKTPPCADLLIEKMLKHVAICNVDPNPQVAGRGIEKMKKAGIKVETGMLEAQGNELNKRFFTFHKKQRPYLVLKWAQTQDGFVARENYDSKWISNPYSRQLVHKWRAEESAIMVGTNTAKYDNPSLTVRDWNGRNPVRIVLDRELNLASNLHLFDGQVETLVFTEREKESTPYVSFIQLGSITPEAMVAELYKRNILSVLVEGGSSLLNSFIAANLWDEARVFTSNQFFEKGIAGPKFDFEPDNEEDILGDRLQVFKNK